MTRRKEYRKESLEWDTTSQSETGRVRGGSLSSWNRCESGQLWGSGKVLQGRLQACEGSDLDLGKGLCGGDLRRPGRKSQAGLESQAEQSKLCVLLTGLRRRRRGPLGGASGQHLARLGWGRGERGGAEGGKGCY